MESLVILTEGEYILYALGALNLGGVMTYDTSDNGVPSPVRQNSELTD